MLLITIFEMTSRLRNNKEIFIILHTYCKNLSLLSTQRKIKFSIFGERRRQGKKIKVNLFSVRLAVTLILENLMTLCLFIFFLCRVAIFFFFLVFHEGIL